MKYLLVLHEALDENLIDEILLAGVKIDRSFFSSDTYIEAFCEGISVGMRLDGDFRLLGYANNAYYHTPEGSHYISGYTEINLDQFLELLGIKESEPFEDELMQLLGG